MFDVELLLEGLCSYLSNNMCKNVKSIEKTLLNGNHGYITPVNNSNNSLENNYYIVDTYELILNSD